MSTVNLYDVLNVSQDSTPKEIKDAYRGLVKEFHPDKPGGDAEMFELVTHAYNILINPNTRKEYDEVYALSKQVETSHFDLKSKSEAYYKATDTDITKKKKSKDDQKKDFERAFEDMDRKHGYRRDKDFEEELTEKDTTRRLRDLQLAREQDDIESIHDKIFDDGRFDLARFNAAFDEMHKGHTELIHHQGNPEAYNVIGGGANFSSIDNLEDLYANDDGLGTSVYGPVKLDNGKKKKLTKEDIARISSADYTKNHNYKDKSYNKTLEEKIEEMKLERQKLEDRTLNDFNTDPSCGGYGIFSGLGMKNLNTVTWDDDEDIKTRYNRLLELRKNDLRK
ncbi:DnaJ chaperone protein [Fadolivirus algeromassiliense]|jgi:curved DNA-binding protein CbpA|uniref:DnaJ chaperone protein n=1 Tax=Fadolivirus FV1/VV64 TaxID=3070911 RepID=A0A7D3R1N5_9VIRU|nr:DnaJ chaperone protein [Fadolivirus algeromassiliense]QKF93938.1 DnaJ chaperone protein [Fadolivirus FV1/VV64]